MYSFATYLKKNKQVGAVTGINNAYVMVEGIPEVKVNELVSFENRAIGLAAQLLPETVRVMHLSGPVPALGTQATLTRELMTVKVDSQVLGALLDGLGRVVQSGGGSEEQLPAASLPIDGRPLPLNRRRMVTQALETGVAIVDILVPLARGQRELVIGDRKTGKTEFVRQTMLSHMFNGGICVYGGIARRAADVNTLTTYFQSKGLLNHLVRVVSMATDTTAACYLAPYTAMAVAEYFRDLGREVVIVLDDMTLHAKYCRELALLARQPPGRNAYPGDIFYAHSRIMERAGVFDKGSITCLPIADTVLGDLSGYIQTNLMSMTDGHLYFDHDLYNQGRRPPVNVFLSVSRVGRQTQTPLLRSLSQELLRFLAHHERLQKLVHFGGELTGDVKHLLALGEQLETFFDQTEDMTIPVAVNAVALASIWAGMWQGYDLSQMRLKVHDLVKRYYSEDRVRAQLDNMIKTYSDFSQLTDAVKAMPDLIMGVAKEN